MGKDFRQEMRWLHTWSGLIVGWLLFAIFVTGTSSYYKNEITLWMQPEVQKSVTSGKSLDIAVDKVMDALKNSDNVSVTLPDSRSNIITLRAEQKGNTEQKNTNKRKRTPPKYYDASNGDLITPRETAGGGFLYRFHFELYNLPRNIARWIVGIATMVMFVAIITGIIIHKRIFKDIFTFRQNSGPRGWMDAHVLPAVAALPFYIVITYSGLLLLSNTIMPWGMKIYYGNDFKSYRQDMINLRNNTEISNDTNEHGNAFKANRKKLNEQETRLTKTQLLKVLNNANLHWIDNVGSFTISKNHKNKKFQIEVKPKNPSSIFNVKFEQQSMIYDAKTGQIIKENTPPLTNSTIINTNTALSSLHMAQFADSTLRFVFFISGISGVVLIGTGLILWTVKRKKRYEDKKSFSFYLVEKLNLGTIVGIFIAIGVYFIANRLIPAIQENRAALEINVFFTVWLLSYIHSFIRDTKQAWIEQLIVCSFVFLLIPIINIVTTMNSFSDFINRDSLFFYFDLYFILSTAIFALAAFILIKRKRSLKCR